ncbi:hypothetical protein [Rhizorhapis suberifaciens]|uniref:Uncharacterized protein n=1 Tax=Rhizorhapis suberifaciens TaxID=13656 RepID=A0A840HV83_9SPHN|nr:hypothetical protein [Rhizorhapis suberifaciens]MBB4641489.1 hypothetical protein [Rhizorhapis suberifaciens]
MFDRVAIIKTGWSEDYRGAKVVGNYSYKHPDHEKVNFLPGPDGRYFCYVPPIGGNKKVKPFGSAPKPINPNGWLVFAVSRNPRTGGLYVVGWYEDALFLHRHEVRPEYEDGEPWFGRGDDGHEIVYTITAPRAYAIDGPERTEWFSGDVMKRHILYLRGHANPGDYEEKLAEKLLAYRSRWLAHLGQEEEPLYVSPEEGAQFKYGGGGFGGGGESPFHEALRLWVEANPASVLPSYAKATADTEVPLLSGDRVDNVYDRRDRIAVIEVKSWISNEDDVERGIYQCIKYRAVMEAMKHKRAVPIDAVLVTERPISGKHQKLIAKHNIIHFEAPKDRK